MHRDLLRDDDLAQHAGLDGQRRGAAAAVPGKQRVRRDRRDMPLVAAHHGGGIRQKRQPRHRLLAVKHLHAVQHLRLPAVAFGFQPVDGVGPHGGVGFVQAVLRVGRGQGDRSSGPGGVGRALRQQRAAFVPHRDAHAGQRRGLPGDRCVYGQSSVGHTNTSCASVCRAGGPGAGTMPFAYAPPCKTGICYFAGIVLH